MNNMERAVVVGRIAAMIEAENCRDRTAIIDNLMDHAADDHLHLVLSIGHDLLDRICHCVAESGWAVTDIYLPGNRLTCLPESIGRLSTLRRMNISNNRLTTLPGSVSELVRLEELDVTRNRLTSLPDSLSALVRLNRLAVSHNWLRSLPDVVGILPGLTHVHVSHNLLPPMRPFLRGPDGRHIDLYGIGDQDFDRTNQMHF